MNHYLETVQSRPKMDLILANIPGMIHLFFTPKSGPWKTLYVSEGIRQLYGIDPKEVVDGTQIWMELLLPQYRIHFINLFREALERPRRIESEFEFVLRDGTHKWVRFVGAPRADGAGGILWDAFHLDVTDRVKAEHALLEEQERSIASANLANLGELAAGVAHEVNTPLSVILLSAQQMLKEREQIQDAHIIKKFECIEKHALRIAKIVKSLKSISRKSSDDPFAASELKSIVEDALELSEEKLKLRGIELIKIWSTENIQIECRAWEISQVLLNLINNAADASNHSGENWIELRIEKTTFRNEPGVVFRVTDSGPLIPSDIANKMMQPFFTTKAVGKGTGLGLSISRSMIEQHRGEFYLDRSAPHTSFVVKLPVKH